MKRKEKNIQIILIVTGFFLILFTYFYYPYLNSGKIAKKKSETEILKKKDKNFVENETTFFENVQYKGMYNFDKPFIIDSKKARILNDEPDIVYMTYLNVEINLPDGRIVNITSERGRYNKETYDIFFEENVKATDGDTTISSKNLDLLATENNVTIYNDVNLKYPTGSLEADKIDYNFESKYFKVSMFDDKSIKMKVVEWVVKNVFV